MTGHTEDAAPQNGDQFALLDHVVTAVCDALSLERALEEILETTLQALGLDTGAITLVDQDGGNARLACTRGVSAALRDACAEECADGASWDAVLHGKALFHCRTRGDTVPEGFSSTATVPLSARGEVLGGLTVAGRDPVAWSDPVRRVLLAIGRETGGLIGRVETEQQVRGLTERLESLAAENARDLEAADRALQDEIRERRRTEGALRASEERLRDLALSSADWIWEMDAEGRYVSCSDRVIDVLGYTPEEMVGRTPFDFMVEEDAVQLAPVLQRKTEVGTGCSEIVNRNRHKDGHEVVLLTSCVPIIDESGTRIGFRGVDKDITLRVHMERALRESEVRYRRTFDLSPDAMLVIDRLSLRIVDANLAAAKLYGYPPAELLTLSMTDLSADPGQAREMLMPAGGVDGTGASRRLHRRRYGQEFPVEVTSATLDFASRGVVAHVVRDVTERDRRTRSVRAIAELQRRLLDADEDEDLYAVVLPPLLTATGADNVSIFENHRDADGCVRSHRVATLDDPSSPPSDPDDGPPVNALDELGPEWSARLQEGSPVAARVDELPEAGRACFAGWGIRSLLVLPLVVYGDLHGHITCLSRRNTHLWDPGEIDLLMTAAAAVSAVVERRIVLLTLRKRTTELTALLEANRAMAASIDYDEVLRRVAQAAGEALSTPECIIWEYSADGDLAVFRCLWELDPKPGVAAGLVGASYPITTYSGGIESLQKGVIVQQSFSDPDLPPDDRIDMEKWGEKTWLRVPLVFDRRLLGVMILIETERERDFTADEVRMAGALGEQAAVALQNALRHRREEDRNRWLRSLIAAGRAVSGGSGPDVGLAEVARLAADAAQSPAAFIYEYLEDRDVLVTRARHATPATRRDDAVGATFPVGITPQDRRTLDAGEVFVETISDPALPANVRDLMQQFGESTLLNVPLRSRGEALGMMVLVENERERVFTREEQEFMAAFGEQVTLALVTARQATTDGLTGLSNHRAFYERLGQELARARRYGTPVSLLMLDIDDFKVLNDTHGHPAGDEVLRRLSRLLAEQLRRDVDLPARYGGEEFAVVLPNTAATIPGETPIVDGDDAEPAGEDADPARDDVPPAGHREGAEALAERLRGLIAETPFPVTADEAPAHLTVSIGVASFPDMAQDMDDLVARADAALYAAKRAGKDRVEVYWRRAAPDTAESPETPRGDRP